MAAKKKASSRVAEQMIQKAAAKEADAGQRIAITIKGDKDLVESLSKLTDALTALVQSEANPLREVTGGLPVQSDGRAAAAMEASAGGTTTPGNIPPQKPKKKAARKKASKAKKGGKPFEQLVRDWAIATPRGTECVRFALAELEVKTVPAVPEEARADFLERCKALADETETE